jgi:hypothetical protein
MPVIQDVDALSGEWHHKSHNTQEAIHGVFAFEFCCICFVMGCGVDKRSHALALIWMSILCSVLLMRAQQQRFSAGEAAILFLLTTCAA